MTMCCPTECNIQEKKKTKHIQYCFSILLVNKVSMLGLFKTLTLSCGSLWNSEETLIVPLHGVSRVGLISDTLGFN